MARVRRRTLLLVVGILVVAAALGGGLLTTVGLPADTDTKSYCVDAGWAGKGNFPDVPGDARIEGELFSRDKTYLSWVSDGTAIPFSVSGKIVWCDGIFKRTIVKLYYEFDIVGLTGAERFHQDDMPLGYLVFDPHDRTAVPSCTQGVCTINAREFTIDGTTYKNDANQEKTIPDGGVLRVTLSADLSDGLGHIDHYGLASDELTMVSGVPAVQWEKSLYQIGEVAKVHWTIPFTTMDTGGAAYFLTITDMNTGSSIDGWSQKALTATTGIASVTVPSSAFSAGGINRVRAEIFSQVFRAGMTDTSAIDDPNKAPVVNSVAFNQAEYREGDTVTITIVASPNPNTKSPISKYYVLAHIGGLVVYDQFSSSAVVSFNAARTGVLTAEVSAYDSEGRPSAVYSVSATIGNVIVDCEAYPDLSICKSPVSGVPLWVFVLLIGIAIILIAVLLPFIPIWPWKVVLILVGVVIIFVAILLPR